MLALLHSRVADTESKAKALSYYLGCVGVVVFVALPLVAVSPTPFDHYIRANRTQLSMA